MPDLAISLKGLTKRFGETVAVNNLSMDVYRGEMFGMVGPDGAGKTTTIRMLTGILKPDEGSGTILGLDLAKDHEKIKNLIGYLSQKFSLYPDLSIDENIEFFAEIHEVKNYKQRRDELLEFTRLTPFRKRLAEQLSGGMKQKLALASTLIHKPQIIFLDEPTTGVDPVSRRDFWKILSSLLHENITILMATPYLDEAERCSRVALMNNAKLLALDTPQRIKGSIKGAVVEIVCDDVRRAYHILQPMPGITEIQTFGDRLNVRLMNVDEMLPKIESKLKEEGIHITQTRQIPTSLENVFIHLMTENSQAPINEVANEAAHTEGGSNA